MGEACGVDALLSILTFSFGWTMWYHVLSCLYFFVSFAWFYSLQKQHHVEAA